MLYNRCSEVDEKFWLALAQADPEDIFRRTGVKRHQQLFQVPYFNRELVADLEGRRIFLADAPEAEPGFRRCLTTLLYLLLIDAAALGPPISPLELPGATMFFQKSGPHAVPSAPLEDRFGRDLAGFLETGRNLGAATRANGDAALAFRVFPGLTVEVILWQADDEFPAQVSFTVPSQLHLFWQLDAVLGLMGVVVKELLQHYQGSLPMEKAWPR
jgi:hypothetical protein